MPKTYACSICNQTFPKFADCKTHEAIHSPEKAYFCTWGGCSFVTLHKTSFHHHTDGHTGEQRFICPHDGCDYKTHTSSNVTKHRKKEHGYVPRPSNRRDPAQSSSQPPPAEEPLPLDTFYQYPYELQRMQPQPQPQAMQSYPTQYQPMQPQAMQSYPTQYQPMQPQAMQSYPTQYQPMQPQAMQSYPTQYQPQSTQYQPPPLIHNQSLGVLYGPTDTASDYTMYPGPAMAPNGWTEGCMFPEMMQRRPSDMPGYEYMRA
ncbi:uncharacterized protein HD556DRAFT_1305737 [Suillus plorans]|uniref:C2H2-type domain-containing protein n=1 Tax=Suillus plorans TaxID=116603 RepID=A0A9P7DN16_9AGAM|nr:uncharacterized protein HD556DRAFT_1305737 [Suillus plorans]KAG1798876.1 hypothetical protein HD556DRAFT_1305737 [Suillus plorans]